MSNEQENLATYMGLGAAEYGVEFLSTLTTSVDLDYSQQGKLLIFAGQTTQSQINVPAPVAGMVFNIYFTGSGGVSTAHKICSSGDLHDIKCITTAQAVACETTVTMGTGITLIGLNNVHWQASRFGGSTLNINSTTT